MLAALLGIGAEEAGAAPTQPSAAATTLTLALAIALTLALAIALTLALPLALALALARTPNPNPRPNQAAATTFVSNVAAQRPRPSMRRVHSWIQTWRRASPWPEAREVPSP